MRSSNDTDPDGPPRPRIPTDPGLGAPGKGGAHASYAAASESDPHALPVRPLSRGDITPVPPETDNLLNGLLEAETAPYFRKTRAAPETSGEGAASYHAEPHAIAPGNPTPPPAPPVVVRPSVEEDFRELQKRVSEAAARREASILDAPVRTRSSEPTEVALPPETRSRAVERWVAFVVAAIVAALIGVMLLRPSPPPAPVETPVQVTTAPPTPPLPPEIPVVQVSALPLAPTVAPAPPPTTQPLAPRPRPPRAAPGDNPPPKSDVKRNL